MKKASSCYQRSSRLPRLIAATLLCAALCDCNHDSPDSQKAATTNHKSKWNQHANQTTPHRSLAIKVNGNKLVNERGEVIQLRGVNLMGMEYTAIGGWWPKDPLFTVVESTWASLHNWQVNVVRIPLNETSYLGIKCVTAFTGPAYGKPGLIQESDPGHNYRARLKEVVERATDEGLYVILDLHYSAPDDLKNKIDTVVAQCATDFNPLPDADHAVAFWVDLAASYKNHPNVMFELFNNPYIDQWRYFSGDKNAAWKALRDGAIINSYLPLWPTTQRHLWRSAGMQQLVNTIRNAGATNVILQGGLARSTELDLWPTYKAIDPLQQIAAAWHAFPNSGSGWGDNCYSHPGSWCDDRAYSYADAILAANYPVIVTEFGDWNARGIIGAPFASALLPRLDSMGISYLGWVFTAGTASDNQLIKDNFGTPTDGYGQYVKAHYLCRALGARSCSEVEKGTAGLPKIPAQPSSESKTGGWLPSSPPI